MRTILTFLIGGGAGLLVGYAWCQASSVVYWRGVAREWKDQHDDVKAAYERVVVSLTARTRNRPS